MAHIYNLCKKPFLVVTVVTFGPRGDILPLGGFFVYDQKREKPQFGGKRRHFEYKFKANSRLFGKYGGPFGRYYYWFRRFNGHFLGNSGNCEVNFWMKTIKKKRSGAYSRRKGHSFEREIANALKRVFPDAERLLEFQVSQANGVDIKNTGRYRIQCKKLKKYASISKIKEVKCDEWLGEVPVLVTAGDNEPRIACLPFDEFLDLLEKAGESDYN